MTRRIDLLWFGDTSLFLLVHINLCHASKTSELRNSSGTNT